MVVGCRSGHGDLGRRVDERTFSRRRPQAVPVALSLLLRPHHLCVLDLAVILEPYLVDVVDVVLAVAPVIPAEPGLVACVAVVRDRVHVIDGHDFSYRRGLGRLSGPVRSDGRFWGHDSILDNSCQV